MECTSKIINANTVVLIASLVHGQHAIVQQVHAITAAIVVTMGTSVILTVMLPTACLALLIPIYVRNVKTVSTAKQILHVRGVLLIVKD